MPMSTAAISGKVAANRTSARRTSPRPNGISVDAAACRVVASGRPPIASAAPRTPAASAEKSVPRPSAGSACVSRTSVASVRTRALAHETHVTAVPRPTRAVTARCSASSELGGGATDKVRVPDAGAWIVGLVQACVRLRCSTVPAVALGRAPIVAVLLGGTTMLAFFSGGYFERARLWAGIVAWILVAVTAVVVRRPWPRTWPAWLTLSGLAGLTAWTALSIGWAPQRDIAQGDAQRLLVYLGVLMAGIAVLRARSAVRAIEPVLAAGAFAAVAEGLSERVVPGLVTLAPSVAAQGRLSQPLTYWNAMGLLAGIGAILCGRLAGDTTRPVAVRAAAAAATPVLAVGVYLPLSRGAALAAAVGLVALAALQPTRAQLRALAIGLAASAPAVLAAAAFDGVRALQGPLGTRESRGLLMLAVLVACGVAAGAATVWWARRSDPRDAVSWPLARRAGRVAVGVMAVATLALFAASTAQRHATIVNPLQGASNERLTNVESNRGDFWRVARHTFLDHPLAGVGSGGFQTEWLRERPIPYAARDAHSLYFETAAELGLVGLLLLATAFAGAVVCAVRARRRDELLAAGPIAVAAMWAVHAGLDWDWELPGVTLPALICVSALVAIADRRPAGSTVTRLQDLPADPEAAGTTAEARL